jgi:hypothetical protein
VTPSSLQVAGGLTCLLATVLAAWVSWARLEADRTHFISEVMALAWWQRRRAIRQPGFWGSLGTTLLFGVGALGFTLAAAMELRTGWSLPAGCSAATGVLLLGVVACPLHEVAAAELRTIGGTALLHPFLAAVFYLSAIVTSIVTVLDDAGPIGTVLAGLHVMSSSLLVVSALCLSPRALGDAAYRPWYLPGVRVLLDLRPPCESPVEWIRRLQWPATLLVGLDLGLTPTGI